MTIYEELKKDHRGVLALLDQLVASEKAGPEAWGRLVQQIRDELVPHARAEEAILYNALRDAGEAQDVVAHSFGEHAQTEAVLRGLQISDALDLTWVGAAKQLRESLSHHIAEEEGKVFAAAKRAFSEQEAEAMGAAFVQMKPRVRGENFAETTAEMIANLLPARLRDSLRKFVADAQSPRRAA
jgi:hemerythrin-like domain-containing protein